MAPSSRGAGAFFDRSLRAKLRADVVLGNLEGTLATGGASKCNAESTNCFAFRAPPDYARALRAAGFTILNLANNHAFDYGAQGRAETLAALRSARLRYTGRPGQISVVRSGRVKVAFLGFAPYPWTQDLRDIESSVRLVRKAARRADIVVVTMHGGAEGADRQHVAAGREWFLGEDRGNVVAFAHAVVRAGADLVAGHGPHVLRGLEWYRGRLIAYSLGNFLGNGTLSIGGILGVSGILHVTLAADGDWLHGDLTPVRLVSPGVPEIDPVESAHGVVRTLSREDFGRDGMLVSRTGILLPPELRTG
jgi:hypothetical protein